MSNAFLLKLELTTTQSQGVYIGFLFINLLILPLVIKYSNKKKIQILNPSINSSFSKISLMILN